jgi:hypothetical protein
VARALGTGVDKTVGVGNEKAVGSADQELGGESVAPVFGNPSSAPSRFDEATFVRPAKGSHQISTRRVGYVVLLAVRKLAKIREAAPSFHVSIGMNFSSPRA